MNAVRTNCPSPARLERGVWEEEREILEHADRCADCGAAVEEIERLRGVAEHLQVPPYPAERREQVRTMLLARVAQSNAVVSSPRRWQVPVAVAVAAAAGIAAFWVLRGEGTVAPHRGHVVAHAAAEYELASPLPDERVVLREGTLSVVVDPLESGERFRVVTERGEVEVVGTAFDVTAEGGVLTSVRVREGVVVVRDGLGRSQTVTVGQRWDRTELAVLTDSPEPAPLVEIAEPDRPVTSIDGPAPLTNEREAQRNPAPKQIGSRRQPPPAPTTGTPPPPKRPKSFDEGFAAIRRGEFAEAAEAFDQAESEATTPKQIEDALYWGGVASGRAGAQSAAGRKFRALLKRYPGSRRRGEVSVMLGWIVLDRGDPAEAERLFKQGLRDDIARVRESAASGLKAVEQQRAETEASQKKQ